jgi:hypothetical protein
MYREGRRYKISTVTYNPFVGGVDGQDYNVTSVSDVNLFTESGGVVTAGTYNFILDGQAFGQNQLAQAITTGSFPSGSVINVVCLNGAIIVGRGGNGGNGTDEGTESNRTGGGAGGLALKGTSAVTVNVYLNGNTGDLGNGSYSANGYLYAPGGGGGGGGGTGAQTSAGGGGGGGAGFFNSTGGRGGDGTPDGGDGDNGQNTSAGLGGPASSPGGNGGALGSAGQAGSTIRASGGAAGSALDINGGTINILTSGVTSRFIKGAGDNPSAIS